MFQIQAIVLGFILSFTQASFAGTREFSVDKTEGISPLTITFNASSIKSAKKFIWVFGDGNNLTTTNPTVTYQYKTPGTFTAALSYQVNASEKNPNYKDAGSVTINVLNQLPKVVLNCSSSKPRSLECNASGSKDYDGSITSYQYAWDDGKSDFKNDDTLIAHAFLAGGTHVVTVTATDNSGGSSKVTQSFVVKENTNPIANFTCTSSTMFNVACSSTSTDPDAPNDSIQSYSWNFGDQSSLASSSSVTHIYSKGGNQNISLTVTDSFGGLNTVTKSIAVKDNLPPVASLSCSTNSLLAACNALSSYDPEGQAIAFMFEYGDGFVEKNTNGLSTHAYSLAGLHTVKLTVTDSLGAVAFATTQVQAVKPPNQLPNIKLNCNSSRPNTLECNGLGSVDSDGSIVSYQYSFDDGASNTKADGSPVTHQFSQSGDHSVVLTVIDNDGGVSTVTKTYSVLTNIAPVANFSCTNTTVRTIRCTSTSSDSDGVIASTTWALDDRSTYNGLNFERIFTDDQAHVIKLQVTDDLGASTSTSSTVQPIKNQAPQADLYASMTSGIAPLAINFEARSALDVDGSIASIEWTFSDGTTALGASISHTFTNVGSFSATLKVTDNLGAVTIKSASITALEPLRESPGVAFKYFEDGSTQITLISNLTKTQFELDHAIYTIDGSQTIPVTEFYPGTRTLVDLKNYGVHTIALTVFDVRGQSASATYQVNLLQDPSTLKPIVDFKITQSNVRTAFFNFNRSFNPDIIFGVRNFRIDYGDGTFANTTSSFATHTYASAGSYTATLTVTTTQGTISSASKIVTVSDQSIPILNPVASFGYQINSWARNVSFYNDRSGTPNGSIISYLWDFGDGSTGTGDRVAHFYEPGDYIVTLTVTDTAGLRNSQTQHVSIYQAGSDLVANIDCGTATTQTQNCNINALDRLNQISSVRVLWGDGTSSTLTNPTVPGQGLYKASKKYFTSGMQTIGLYVYTTRGEVGTATVTKNIILPNPVASINCYSNNLLANCNALASYDPKGGPLTFTFNYQDGFVETNASGISSHAYQAAGLYNVTVTVKDITGLSSVAATVVQMVVPQNKLPHPQLYCFSNSPNILRCNANASYDEDGTIVSYRYDWDDNASEVHAGSDEIFHIFTTSGSHQVTLTVTDNDGGVNSITNSFNVQANNPPVAVIHCYNIGPQKIHCNSDSYESDPNDLISEFKWDLGDGSSPVTTMVPSIEYFYAEFGSYNISLQVKDLLGANSSSSQNITVLENKAPILNPNCFINTGSTYQCNSNAYDPDGTIVSQTWTVEGETLSGPTINHTFANGGSYQVSLLVIDNLGKQTSQTITLNIDKPNINFECHETDPMMYQCLMDYSSVSNEDDPVVSSTFIFDDQQMLPGPGVIYEFYSFGVHSVKVKLRTASGKISTLNQNISIPQKYLPPRPLYLEEVLMDKKVYFDGSLSALAGKAVAQYEWDFGDGQIISGTNAVITHQFNSYGWFDVKLKVTDDRGAVKDTVSAIYVYDPQVEAPADSTSSSIAGVDTDSDGIRDDVQRWINKNSFESLTAKRAFKALAGIYKTQILNVNNESTLQSLENQKAKAAACVDSLIVAEYGVTKSVEFELIYLNSNARMLNFAKIKDSLSGYIPKMTPAQQTDVCADWR